MPQLSGVQGVACQSLGAWGGLATCYATSIAVIMRLLKFPLHKDSELTDDFKYLIDDWLTLFGVYSLK